MAWIESHDDIWEHHKTVRLIKILGVSDVQTVGHLQSLWHFVLRNAWRDANLEQWGDDGIEAAARWRGEPGVFVKALRSVGYLDGNVAHGWMERAGKLVKDRFYNENRRQDAAESNINDVLRRKSGATLPYPTLPYPTQPTEGDAPKRTALQKPTAEEVKAYCLERKNSVDAQKFVDYYASNGWKVGRNPMKDWKACVRTWERNDYGGGLKAPQSRIVGGAAPVPGKYAHLGK